MGGTGAFIKKPPASPLPEAPQTPQHGYKCAHTALQGSLAGCVQEMGFVDRIPHKVLRLSRLFSTIFLLSLLTVLWKGSQSISDHFRSEMQRIEVTGPKIIEVGSGRAEAGTHVF